MHVAAFIECTRVDKMNKMELNVATRMNLKKNNNEDKKPYIAGHFLYKVWKHVKLCFLLHTEEVSMNLKKGENDYGNISMERGFRCGSAGKESACNAGGLGSIPGLGRSPGEGKG